MHKRRWLLATLWVGTAWSAAVVGLLAAEKRVPPDVAQVVVEATRRAEAARNRGELSDAAAWLSVSLEALEGRVGPNHPAVAEQLDLLGAVALIGQRYDDAEVVLARALTIVEHDRSQDRIKGSILTKLGQAHIAKSEFDKAEDALEEAVKLLSATGDPDTASALQNLGVALLLRGEPYAAEDKLRRALEVIPSERSLAAGLTLRYLGDSLAAQQRTADAVAAYERADELVRRHTEDKKLLESIDRALTTLKGERS